MATYTKFQNFITNQFFHKVDWDADTFKVMLTNTAPTAASNTVYADVSATEITGGGTTGYTTGGTATTISTTYATGTQTVKGTQVVFTGGASGMGPFRYAILYDSSTVDTIVAPLVAYFDYGSSISLANGETFTVQFNSTSPGTIFTAS